MDFDGFTWISFTDSCSPSFISWLLSPVFCHLEENYCANLKRGERCILEGKVTRAFGSSMEVVVRIFVAKIHSGTLRMVGHAYFMWLGSFVLEAPKAVSRPFQLYFKLFYGI